MACTAQTRRSSNGSLHSGESENPTAPHSVKLNGSAVPVWHRKPGGNLDSLHLKAEETGWVLVSAKTAAATEKMHSPAGSEDEQAKNSTAFPSNLFKSGPLPGGAAHSRGGLSTLSQSFQEIFSQT